MPTPTSPVTVDQLPFTLEEGSYVIITEGKYEGRKGVVAESLKPEDTDVFVRFTDGLCVDRVVAVGSLALQLDYSVVTVSEVDHVYFGNLASGEGWRVLTSNSALGFVRSLVEHPKGIYIDIVLYQVRFTKTVSVSNPVSL